MQNQPPDPKLVVVSVKNKANEPTPLKRQQIEDKLDTVAKDLQEKHADKYTLPQFRRWAHMITSGKHQDRDNIPAFLDLDNQAINKSDQHLL